MELRPSDHLHERELLFLKGNYLLDEWKKKSLLLGFNENQQFSYIETIGSHCNTTNKERIFPEDQKQLIIEEAKKLRETGLSYDKILIKLKEKFDRVPSKGALLNWLKVEDSEDAQSVEQVEE